MSFRKATSVAAAATAAAATLSLLLSLTGTSTSTITITITGSGTHRQSPAAVPAIPSDDGTGSLSPQRRRRPQRQRQRQRQRRTPHQRRRRRTDEDVENSTQAAMDDDDVVVDDDGALSSSSSLFADDGDFNGDANSTADDDDEWYLPEHQVTQPVLRGFGAGSANDWGLVLSMIGGSGGNTTDDDVEANGSDLFFDGSSASDVLFSYAVPLVSLSPEFLLDSADGDGGNGEEGAEAEAVEEMEQSDSLYRMSAGNVHSAVLTLQGKVYTAGSWGVEEDRGLGRSLDEGDYDLSDYSFSWGASDGGDDDDNDDNDNGLNNGVNDDVVTQDDDLTDDNVTYVPNNDTETDIEIDDEFDNATMTITSTTTTAATRPSRPTTTTSTTTTTAASSSSSSPSSIEIAPTIYSFQPITELYAYSPSSDSHVLQTLPSDLPKFTQIQTSQYFTFLLDDRGRVYATGINTHGQLCLNDTDSRDRFYEVPPSFLFEDPSSGDNGRIVDVALGERHTLLLRDDGKVLACGWNAYGQLGIGTVDLAVVKPVLVVIDAPDLQNEDGQNETSQQDATENNDDDRDTNDDIALDTNATNATAPETAASNTTTVPESQTNLTATDSTSPPTASLTPSPTLPPIPIDTAAIVGITAGRGSSYFLTRSGHVFSAGTNYEGQLCLGHRDDRTLPSLVDTIAYSPSIHSPNGTSVRSIAAGRSSFYVRMEDGSVYSCGSNAHGQLGIGAFDLDSVDVPRPVLLEGYHDDDDVDVDNANATFTNFTNDHDDPREPLVDITRVFSGPLAYNAFFLSANGTIYAVGYNGAGQLGVGDETNRHAAAVVACSNGVLEKDEMAIWTEDAIEERTFVSTGNDHVLFLGREEWFLGCRGGIVVGGDDDGGIFFPPNEEEEEDGANDTERVSTAAPTASAAPSTSFVPSSAPSVSLAPTVSPMPSSVPSASLMPTLTPRPTEEEESIVPTFGPTPGYGSYPPTLSLEDAVGFPDDGSGSAGGGSDRGVVSGVSRMGGGLCGYHFGVSLVFLGMMTFWR